MSEDATQDRAQDFHGPPDGYIRKSSLFQTVGAVVGLLGAYVGISGLLDRYLESVRTEVRNERVERINQFNRIDQRIDSCCRRGR